MTIHQQMPTHPVPRQASRLAASPQLRIDGLVAEPSTFAPADLAHLARKSFCEDFHCEQNWTVPQQKWSGVRLIDVLDLVEPLPNAKYVRIHAGNYVVPLSLAEAEQALLADSLNDQPLTVEQGAPWRLALAGAACYTSVKWVDRLELALEPGANVGQQAAEARRRIHLARTAPVTGSEEIQPVPGVIAR
jgi:DMSO/TMAO reductase YedYZ molybdopterin-dependent catalytic subunit